MVFLRTHQPYSGTEVLMETKLERIAEISANSPRPEFTSLYHLINKEMLLQCHKELDGNKAVGVDEITKKEYGRNLEQNLDDLVERLKRKSYKPQPSIRVYIPKSNGKLRPLHLKGTEKILDLACGFGRHSLEFARRGYDVTGIDITPAYIDYANEQAKKENLNAKFICQDIRTITFDEEFDVVLNMADGAIGYLEDDGENHKIFSGIAKALKNGGKHFMDIMNGSYAQTHFPCKLWDAGEKGLTLSAFEWEKDRKTLIYGQVDYMYGEALYKPEMKEGNPIRLYSLDEITEIFCKLGLRICNSFADFSGKPSSDNDIQLMVYSIRE